MEQVLLQPDSHLAMTLPAPLVTFVALSAESTTTIMSKDMSQEDLKGNVKS
jgi:hypothetical protein